VRFRRRAQRRASSAETCLETADFEIPIFLAASVKPLWTTPVAKASISVNRSIVVPMQTVRVAKTVLVTNSGNIALLHGQVRGIVRHR
jgi:hypothetical protein